ncbi:MAG: FUSC family protein [Desulfobacter sp.]|nr:MAG: FUSC family protein [Desulfobacter sp.]
MKLSYLHMLHGFKTALAAIIAYIITLVFNLEFGYWAVISTVIVMQVYVADSIDMCLYRLSGTLIGAVLGVGVMLIMPNTPIGIGIGLFVTIGICAFLTRYKTRYRMAAITVVIIIMTGIADPNIIMFGISRVIEIGLGIICAFGVSVLVFPRRKADVLRTRLKDQAQACDRLCHSLVHAFIHKQQHVDEIQVEHLVDQVRENQAFLSKIHQHEALIYRLTTDHFQAKVFLMGRAVQNLRTMARILNSLEGEGHEIIMANELEAMTRVSGHLLICLVTNNPNLEKEKLARMINELDTRLLGIRKEGLTARFDLKRLVQVFSFYNSFKYYAEDILAGAERIRAQQNATGS